MNPEAAIKLAILLSPQSFGLSAEAVNPLLLYLMRQSAAGDNANGSDPEIAWEQIFAECSQNLHAKTIEVLSGKVAAKPKDTPPARKRKSESKGSTAADTSAKLTNRQLRYIGYLERQLDQEPNYDEISNLTVGQATMRIKDLEKRLGRG